MKFVIAIILAVMPIGLMADASAATEKPEVAHIVKPSKTWLKPKIEVLKKNRDRKLRHCQPDWCREIRRSYRIKKRDLSKPYEWSAMSSTVNTSNIVRWNPCRTITYYIDYTGSSVDVDGRTPSADWNWSLSRFEQATGFHFVEVSKEEAFYADLQVNWVDAPKAAWAGQESTVAWESDSPVGVDGASHSYINLNLKTDRIGVRRSVIMHELGHMAGLDHSTDGRSIMRPLAGTMTEYSPADLVGLWTMGMGGGCW